MREKKVFDANMMGYLLWSSLVNTACDGYIGTFHLSGYLHE